MSLPEEHVIRASSLSMFPDCMRRTAARLFPELIAAAGFRLRRLATGIGAATGTACHTGAAYGLRERIEHGNDGNDTEAEQRALDDLKENVSQGCIWDDTSPDLNTAEKQTVRQVRAYRAHVAPTIEPVAVEEELRATLRPGFVIVGHSDCREPNRIRDLKTGVRRRANGFQYGTYSLLSRANGHEIEDLIEDYIPRARMNKPQPRPEAHGYDVAEAEQAAFAIANRMADDVEAFMRDGNEWAFLPNPASMLCGEKYCPAWGTKFCRAHKED